MPKKRRKSFKKNITREFDTDVNENLKYLHGVYQMISLIFPKSTQSQDEKNNENIYRIIFQFFNNTFFPINNDDFFGSFNMVMRFVSEKSEFAFKIKHYIDSWQLKILMLCVYNQESVEELIKKSNYTKRLATANQEFSSNQELSFQECKKLNNTYLKSHELLKGFVIIPKYEALNSYMAITEIMTGLQPASIGEILQVAIFMFFKNYIIDDLALNLKKNESGTLVLPDPEQLEEIKKTNIRSLNPRNIEEEKEFNAKLYKIEEILKNNQIIYDIRNINKYSENENNLIRFLSFIINEKIAHPNGYRACLLFKIFIEDISLHEQKEIRSRIIRGEIKAKTLEEYADWLLNNKFFPSKPWEDFIIFSRSELQLKSCLDEKIQNIKTIFSSIENPRVDQFSQGLLFLFDTQTEEAEAPETDIKTTNQPRLTFNQALDILLQYAQFAHRKKTNKINTFKTLADNLINFILTGQGNLLITKSLSPLSTNPDNENTTISQILPTSLDTTESDSIENTEGWRPKR